MVIIGRRLGATTRLRLMVDRTTLGKTTGYRSGIADSVLGGFLILQQAVTTFSIVADVGQRGDRGFYGGVGPSVLRVSMKNPDWDEAPNVSATKVGATIVLGYDFTPPETRFSFGLEAQCRLAGTVRFGPLDNRYTGRLPAADVNLIHGVLALGFGIRL